MCSSDLLVSGISGLEDWNCFHLVPVDCLAGCGSVEEFHLLRHGQNLKTQSLVSGGLSSA